MKQDVVIGNKTWTRDVLLDGSVEWICTYKHYYHCVTIDENRRVSMGGHSVPMSDLRYILAVERNESR